MLRRSSDVRVARLHNIPESELYRFTPHSIRIGMATHLHNMGMTTLMILQMGRWSMKSSAAPRYQRLGQGVCSMAAATMRRSNRSKAHTSEDTLKFLIRPHQSNLQYGEPTIHRRDNSEPKGPHGLATMMRTRGDLRVPVADDLYTKRERQPSFLRPQRIAQFNPATNPNRVVETNVRDVSSVPPRKRTRLGLTKGLRINPRAA